MSEPKKPLTLAMILEGRRQLAEAEKKDPDAGWREQWGRVAATPHFQALVNDHFRKGRPGGDAIIEEFDGEEGS